VRRKPAGIEITSVILCIGVRIYGWSYGIGFRVSVTVGATVKSGGWADRPIRRQMPTCGRMDRRRDLVVSKLFGGGVVPTGWASE